MKNLKTNETKNTKNINPVVTAPGKMPKHQSCRHGNRKIPGDYAFSGSPSLTVTVFSGSYAEQYCIDHKISYKSQ